MKAIDMFNDEDLRQLEERGVDLANAAAQIAILRHPPAAVALARPCTPGDGIRQLDRSEQARFEQEGAAAAAAGRLVKFVPASGAASRMFNELTAALEGGSTAKVRTFFERLDDFPFAPELRRRAGADAGERELLRTLIDEMDYGARPKGLIPFHRAGNETRSAFEEQLLEASQLVRDAQGVCRVHFTVSPAALEDFRSELARVAPSIEHRSGCRLDVTFSVQHPATDTLAIGEDGSPSRASDGTLLFRPGGHGALLRNLQELGADLVTIKNIDNVLPDEANQEAIAWKQRLLGVLLAVQRETFDILRECSDSGASDHAIHRAITFAKARFNREPDSGIRGMRAAHNYIEGVLDRPIRVCGVVRNEGEPGGAPFWTRDLHGGESVQIVEASQVNFADGKQKAIWDSSTHFNPVDLVCGLRNWKGEPFDLRQFVDERTAFAATKSYEGRTLRALELPGLWNGAMARWNTICVEVPASTFAPVKTVFDLLRPQHQPRK